MVKSQDAKKGEDISGSSITKRVEYDDNWVSFNENLVDVLPGEVIKIVVKWRNLGQRKEWAVLLSSQIPYLCTGLGKVFERRTAEN